MNITYLRDRALLDDTCPLPIDRPFTTRQANSEGVRPDVLQWMIEHGFVRRLVRGVYVATQVPDSTWLRCQALGLVVPDDCVVVDRHAAWLLGAPMALAPNEHLELQPIRVFRPSGRGRLRNGLAESGERNVRARDITTVNGLAVTTPLRTALDLGRARWPEPALCGIDVMLRLGVEKRALLGEIERFRGMRWVRTLRAVAPLGDGRSESPGETVLRLRWIEAGLPTPRPQVRVMRDGLLIARLDIGNEDLRFAAEYDGVEWHSSPEQRDHDLARRADAAEDGWEIEPFTAEQVFDRNCTAERVLRARAMLARQSLARRTA